MKLLGIGPGRQSSDHVEAPKQLAHHLAGVLALAELLELFEDPRQRVFRLRECVLGVVLTLTFQAAMMFEKFLAEELRKTLARRPVQWRCRTWMTVGVQSTLQGHLKDR